MFIVFIIDYHQQDKLIKNYDKDVVAKYLLLKLQFTYSLVTVLHGIRYTCLAHISQDVFGREEMF